MKRFTINFKLYLILIAFSFLQGLLITPYITLLFKDISIFKIAWMVMALVLSFELSIIIHEGGHLIFGIMSGYRFLSIRYRNLFIKRDEEGMMKVFKQSILGTGGQCLMIPPKSEDAPVILFNAGGVMLNLLTVICTLIIVKLVFISNYFIASFLWIFLNIHLLMAFVNWISLKGVINDGKNHRIIKNNPNAKTALLELLTYNAMLTNGVPLSTLTFKRDYQSVGNETTLQRNVLAYYSEQAFHHLDYEKGIAILDYADIDHRDPSIVDGILALSKYAMLLMIDKDKAINYEQTHQKLIKQGRMIAERMYSGSLLNLTEAVILDNKWNEKEATRYLDLIEKDPVPGVSKDSKIIFDTLYRRYQANKQINE